MTTYSLPDTKSPLTFRRSYNRTPRSTDLKIVLTRQSVVNALLLSYVALTPLIVIPIAGLIGASDLLFLPAVALVLLVGNLRRCSTSHLILVAFLALAGASLYQTRDLTYVIKWGRLVGILFPFVLACFSTVTLKQAIRVFFWSGFLSILVGVGLWWFDIVLFAEEANQRIWIESGESRVRAGGISGNSCVFGALIAIWAVVCGMFAISEQRPNRLLLATIFLTATVGLISSVSRIAFVAIVAGVVGGGSLMLMDHLRRRGSRLSGHTMLPVVLAIVVMFFTLFFIIPQLMDQEWLNVIYSRFDPRAHSSSNSFLSGRVAIWQHYLQSMDQWGAFGVGYKQGHLHFLMSPHNQFLALASECGIPCLCLFTLFVVNVFTGAISNFRDKPVEAMMCLAVVSAFIADSLGGEPLGSWQVTPVTMILLGICVRNFSVRKSADRHRSLQDSPRAALFTAKS